MVEENPRLELCYNKKKRDQNCQKSYPCGRV